MSFTRRLLRLPCSVQKAETLGQGKSLAKTSQNTCLAWQNRKWYSSSRDSFLNNSRILHTATTVNIELAGSVAKMTCSRVPINIMHCDVIGYISAALEVTFVCVLYINAQLN